MPDLFLKRVEYQNFLIQQYQNHLKLILKDINIEGVKKVGTELKKFEPEIKKFSPSLILRTF